MSLERQGSKILVAWKRGVTVFTCDWCLQDVVGLPTLLRVRGRHSKNRSENECLCSTCADLAASEDMHRIVVAISRIPLRVRRSVVHAAA